MKLIIKFYDSDGFEWQTTNTIPIEYESTEQILIDMKEWAEKDAVSTTSLIRGWNGTGIKSYDILGTSEYSSITIMKLDEWFESHEVLKENN